MVGRRRSPLTNKEVTMQRRHLMAGGLAAMVVSPSALAQAPEKPRLTIAVGGKNLLYFLPLTIAEERGFFKAEGLNVNIVDFAGGARALAALLNGGADVVSGAFMHTVNMQFKGHAMRAFALQGRTPQIVLGFNPRAMGHYRGIGDLRGRRIGVTTPGSSTHSLVNFVLARAGLRPGDVSIVGVGAGQGAVAAMRANEIDAMSNLEPVVTLLLRSGDLKIITDTRIPAESARVFGGPMPAACLYAPQTFIDRNPHTTQALANAIVRANKWLQAAGPGDIIKAVPESYLLGDRAVYIDAFMAAKGALSPDGSFPSKGADTAFRALASVDEKLSAARLDLNAVYTNDFVLRANAKYPQG